MLTKPDFTAKKIVLVFAHEGEKISFKNDNLIVEDKEKNIKVQITCYSIFAVFIAGHITITTGIIERSKKFGFSIVLFSAGFKVYSTINFLFEGNTILRAKQYTTDRSVEIANKLIICKIENQKNTLKKLRDKNFKEGIKKLKDVIKKLSENKYNNYEIMGFEGISAKVYFNRIFKEFNWQGRQPRVKRDKINLLLDIGYSVLFNYIEAILNIYGFDVYKGNLHQEFYKRKSLVCDIIEPFRPIVDYKIRKLINLAQLDAYEFKIYKNQYQLDWKNSNDFVKLILEEILIYKTRIFDFIQSYYRWFMKNDSIENFPKAALYDTD